MAKSKQSGKTAEAQVEEVTPLDALLAQPVRAKEMECPAGYQELHDVEVAVNSNYIDRNSKQPWRVKQEGQLEKLFTKLIFAELPEPVYKFKRVGCVGRRSVRLKCRRVFVK